MVSYTWSCDLNGEVASPVSIDSAHRSRSSLMFPADISACRYKKSAVLNCTPSTNGYQGVSGKGHGGGGCTCGDRGGGDGDRDEGGSDGEGGSGGEGNSEGGEGGGGREGGGGESGRGDG